LEPGNVHYRKEAAYLAESLFEEDKCLNLLVFDIERI